MSVEDGVRKRLGRNARVLPTFFGRSEIGDVGADDGGFVEWLDDEDVEVGGDKPALTRSIRRVSTGPANLAGAAEDDQEFEARFVCGAIAQAGVLGALCGEIRARRKG